MALKYAREAREAFAATEKREYEQDASVLVAESYLNNRQFDESIRMADSLAELFEKEGDEAMAIQARRIAAYSYIGKEETAKAIEELRIMMSSPGYRGYTKDYRNIGMAYYASGDTANAMFWLGKLNPAGGDDKYVPWEVYADRGDYREAFSSLQAEYRDANRRVSAILRDNVSRAVVEYNEEMARSSEERAAAERRRTLFIVAAAVIAAIAGAAGFIVYRRRKTERLREVMAMVDELRLSVSGGQDETPEADSPITPLVKFGKCFKRINDLCDSYFAAGANQQQQGQVMATVEKMLRAFRKDRGVLYELEQYLDQCNDGLMGRFRMDFPKIPDSEALLMLLLAAGFSTSAICVITGVKLQTVYNREATLRKRIECSGSEHREQYLRVCKRGKMTASKEEKEGERDAED